MLVYWSYHRLALSHQYHICALYFHREKPGDEEWTALDQRKLPLLLNLAQCLLLQKDYYPAIEHTTEVLKRDPGEDEI